MEHRHDHTFVLDEFDVLMVTPCAEQRLVMLHTFGGLRVDFQPGHLPAVRELVAALEAVAKAPESPTPTQADDIAF